jgi:cytoplasmic iron level regulating protein YaaA (DUF328/UPF0246 family)
VLILLPPSEGKADAGTGRKLQLDGLSLPALNPAREKVLDTLIEVCTRDEERARAALGLTGGQTAEIRRNAALREARTLPVSRLYTGVLYEALELATLPSAALTLLRRQIVVFSGLWGAVRLTDKLPPYRCSMGARLPGLGQLGGFWRDQSAGPLNELAGKGVVLDLRSSAYVSAWAPPQDRTVTVRVLQERVVNGAVTRSVVSHFNKATKGRIVRRLAEAGANPRTVPALTSTLRDLGFNVESATTGQLDVVLPPDHQ